MGLAGGLGEHLDGEGGAEPLLPGGPGTARRWQHPPAASPERCQSTAEPLPAPGESAQAAAHKEGFITRPGT